MVKEDFLNPSIQWSNPRPTKDASEGVRGTYALRTDGSAYSPGWRGVEKWTRWRKRMGRISYLDNPFKKGTL